MKYITLFETAAAYNAATLDLPNVSLIEETMGVSYNPYVPETKLVCKYNVTSTSSPTTLRTNFEENIFKSMEIDGVMLDELVAAYTFNTTGEHTVKYELYDETKLGNQAPVFYNSNLIECIIPNSVTNISYNVFNNCSGLTSVTIGSSVTSIGNNAFDSCGSLTSIDIPDSVTNINSYAFENCSGLTSIIIPDSVTNISQYAFRGCNGLTSVTIGSSVTSIGNNAFSGCDNLTSMTVDSNNTVYDSRNNCNGIINTSTNAIIQCCKNTIIPDSVTSIGYSAFSNCIGLTSIDIPDSVTSIDDSAFYGCTNLTSIDIPDSVTSIDANVFNGCSSLTSVTIGSGVTSIGNYAFQDCSSLTIIDIPDSVTSIGNFAFRDCSSLASIVSNAITAPTIESFTFQNIKTGGTLTVPSGSTGYDTWMSAEDYYLGKYNWTKVEPSFFCKLTLNDDSVVELEDSGELTSTMIQDYKSTLVNVEIGKLCTSIGEGAFVGCTGLTSITIGNNVTIINDGAFYNCSGLTSIDIPDSVTSIGVSAFANCGGITSITIPDSVTSIGMGAFGSTDALNVLNYNAKCELSSSFRAGWVNLETVIIGDSTPSIGSAAFADCTGLTSVTIGSSVTNIAVSAFAACSGLTNIVSNAMTAPIIYDNTFKDVKMGGTLTVPSGSTGYDTWMDTGYYYLGKYNWTKVEQ